MLLLTSADSVLETILVGMKANSIPVPQNQRQLRRSYQHYLRTMQPNCFWLRDDCVSIEDSIRSGSDQESRKRVIETFAANETALDDRNQGNAIKIAGGIPAHAEDSILHGLSFLLKTSELHYQFLDSFIETIFIEDSDVASGGSTSDAVGLIWSNPHPKFTSLDMAEFFVHELTHNLLFLDEWVHPHYDYSVIMNEDTWCKSAILRTRRPVDKVVHSLVVAAELVLYRKMHSGEPAEPRAHPPSADIVVAIESSIMDLRRLPNSSSFIYPRVWRLLDEIEEKVLKSRQTQLAMTA